MDRRNFFKRFGSVAVVPFVPFKWERPKGEIYKTPVGPVKKVKRDKAALAHSAYHIYIDNYDFTNLCTSIEVRQDAVPVDVTNVQDAGHFRRFAMGLRHSIIRASFIMTYDDVWKRLNLIEAGTLHSIMIVNLPVGVIYECKTAVLKHAGEFAEVNNVVKVELEFTPGDPMRELVTRSIET